MKKLALFSFSILFSVNVLAQIRIPVVTNPLPNPSTGPSQHAPILMPEAFVEEGYVYVWYPYSTDMTISVQTEEGNIVYEETFFSTSTAAVGEIVTGTYRLVIVINGQLFEGEFEIE